MARTSAPADWSALPAPAIVVVSRRLTTHGDYSRFRSVCTSWRSAVPARPPHLPSQVPWLAFPFPDDSDACRFFRLPDGSIHSIDLPWARGNHCCGSSSGWLAFLDTSIDLFLLNPFTRQRIPLPPLRGSAIPDVPERVAPEPGSGYVVRQPSGLHYTCDFDCVRRDFVNRFVLSSDDPTARDCVAMAVFNCRDTLAFCRPGGGSSWTVLPTPISGIGDVVFHRGRFYAVDAHMALYVCDLNPPERIREFPYPGEEELPGYYIPHPMERCLVQGRRRRGDVVERIYLVESRGGDLLMVLRTYDDIFVPPFDGDLGHLMLDFEVYRLDVRGPEQPRWVELENLGDQALFLGPGCSVSMSTGDFPPGVCRRNCIYFSDYWPERHRAVVHGGPDFGVFDFGNGHVERVPCCPADAGRVWRPSIWVMPGHHTSSSH